MAAKNPLHQLLAVENDRKQKALLIIKEAKDLFNKKGEHFDGLVRTYRPFEEKGEPQPPEMKEIVTTVDEKINYVKKSVIDAIDTVVSKEETNSSHTVIGQLVVKDEGGEIEFGEFSATSLLALEQWLTQIREMFKDIPTLDPTRTWIQDTQASRPGVYNSPHEVKYRTEKRSEPLVSYPATKEFPAQVQIITRDIPIGQWDAVHASGRLTPARKSQILERVDTLIDGVKSARARANHAEVIQIHIGKKIFDYINS